MANAELAGEGSFKKNVIPNEAKRERNDVLSCCVSRKGAKEREDAKALGVHTICVKMANEQWPMDNSQNTPAREGIFKKKCHSERSEAKRGILALNKRILLRSRS